MQKNKKIRTSLNKNVILPSLIFIISICLISAILPVSTGAVLNVVKEFVFVNLNWVYVWSVTIFVLFLIYLMFSKYANVRLGRNDSKPEYSFFSWISMLFAAGMGIGLMYFGVAEPMQHYTSGVISGELPAERARAAQTYTFFHWGIHAWAIYAVVGLSLSYFSYRYRLPLSLRSCFYPLLKDRIKGKWGDAIDIFALCSTFFGITTTLGFGVVQVNAGLQQIGLVPDTSFVYQTLIVGVLVSMAILSATSGVGNGIRILSNINIVAVVILLLFILVLGPTVYLISSFTDGIGTYINNFFTLTFNTHVYESESLPWFYNWTILYWAWWISWSPYVGIFIARISKGRTIREFIAAVLIIPSLFNFIWMTVFGNSAIWFDMEIANGALSSLVSDPDSLLFRFLEYFPFSTIASYLVIMIILIFFVTSADSGIFVMNSIATKNSRWSPKWQLVAWGVLLAVLSLLLLNVGGLDALQTMTLITALPFSVIMLLFVVSLMKALAIDQAYYDRKFSATTVPWSGENWKDRLKQIVSFRDRGSVDRFINGTIRQGMEELKEELKNNNVDAEIYYHENPTRVELEIKYDTVNDFKYGVRSEEREVSGYFLSEDNLPGADPGRAFYPETYFGDGRDGYSVEYFTKNELISDVLKHYERFMDIVSEEKNNIFISSNSNKRFH
ncbi:MAG: BCCT family transporter [Sphingobacterium sp.]